MSVVKEVLEKFEFFNQNNTLVQNLNLFINYVTQSGYMSQTVKIFIQMFISIL